MDHEESTSSPSPITIMPMMVLLPLVATATVVIASSSILYWYRGKKTSSRAAASKTTSTSTAASASASASSSTTKLKNVWDAPQRNVTSQQRVVAASHPTEKPFGSKYYYAHNNPNATGGYKDGLKMEDYTMNEPRLLSKGGKPITGAGAGAGAESNTTSSEEEGSSSAAVGNTSNNKEESSSPTSSSSTTTTTTPNKMIIRHVTKYLWDDPGDSSKGIATIRIDSLPSIRQTKNATTTTTTINDGMVDWKDVPIDKVEAKLDGEGLLVQIYSSSSSTSSTLPSSSAAAAEEEKEQGAPSAMRMIPVLYQLKIPKLYGDVASVQAIVKPKRLLIKLTKKKITSSSIFSSNNNKKMKTKKNNLDAWPHPHRKI